MAERYVVHELARALSASATKTLVQLVTGSTRRARIIELGISFDGITAATPVKCDLLLQTSAGTMSAFTPVTELSDGPAAIATAQVNATAEPTAGSIMRSWYVTPFSGLFVVQFPLGREPTLGVSARIGLRAITATGVTPNASAYVVFEE